MRSLQSQMVAWLSLVAVIVSCGRAAAPDEQSPAYRSASHALTPGPAKRVKKISQVSPQVNASFAPADFVRLGNLVVFSAIGAGGRELWRSDGTTNGTVLVRDIWPGSSSSNITSFTEVNGTVFFVANDGLRGAELWKTDGTTTGTVLVKDICPTLCDSNPLQLRNVNGTLVFLADDGTSGRELWTSDGTEAGTVLLKDIRPGSGSPSISSLTSVNDVLFFLADDGVSGQELWKTDGTAAGTMLVRDINPGRADSRSGSLTNLNGTLFFVALEPTTGRELWKSDGTEAGTVRVKDINPSGLSGFPQLVASAGQMRVIGGTLFFTADDGTHGVELWKTDGTEAGTVLVKDINPGALTGIGNLTGVGGTLYFLADDGMHGQELWKSDGTEAGTTLVADLVAGTGSSSPASLTNFEGTLIFTAITPATGKELWRTDGTEAGTTLVKDLSPGAASSKLTSFSVLNHSLFFYNDVATTSSELWETDGTDSGTRLIGSAPSAHQGVSIIELNGLLLFQAEGALRGLDAVSGVSSLIKESGDSAEVSSWAPAHMVDVNGTLFFSAGDATHGVELWKSDGTEEGTVLVKDTIPGTLSGVAGALVNLNGTLIFSIKDPAVIGNTSYRLWRSDGTEAGTYEISKVGIFPADFDIRPEHETHISILRNELYYMGVDAAHGDELWKTDGTEAGTMLVEDIVPGPTSKGAMVRGGLGAMFFTGQIGDNWGLWRTDGTPGSAVLLREFDTHHLSGGLDIISVGKNYIYPMFSSGGASEMWRSDGTAAGTVRVDGSVPFPWPQAPSTPGANTIVELNGAPYFLGVDGSYRMQLGRLGDAVDSGTSLIKGFDAAFPGLNAIFTRDRALYSRFMEINGAFFFTAYDSASGAELWTSDGTTAGTVLLKDISPGIMSSRPSGQTRVGDAIVFRAADEHGWELWRSGRTAESTILVQDLQPGPAPSSPDVFVRSGDKVFFTAMDDDFETELFVIPATEIDTPPQIICPDDITVAIFEGEGSTVAFTAAASDLETTVTPSYSQEPGSFFPLGMHTVTATVVDGLGTSVSCSFHVTVRPFIVCPADFTVEATSSAGAVVPFEATTIRTTPITYSSDPGAPLPLGKTRVTATAEVEGKMATCSFNVTVVDTTPPAIAPLQDITVEAPTDEGVTVEYPPFAVTDAVSLPTEVATPASGSLFPIGETPVTVVATDAAGNHSEGSFRVIVTLKRHKIGAGCGCSSGEAWSGALLLLGLIARVRRHRVRKARSEVRPG